MNSEWRILVWFLPWNCTVAGTSHVVPRRGGGAGGMPAGVEGGGDAEEESQWRLQPMSRELELKRGQMGRNDIHIL